MNPSLAHLIRSLTEHGVSYPGEKTACDQIISWIEKYQQYAFVRENFEGHITGSILITNPEKTKVLLMLHKKFQRWQQFGGHCEGELNVRDVAIREFHEESGIIIDPILSGDIFMVTVHDIPVDQKGTPPHKHFDIMYLGIIPEDTDFIRQESEVDDIRWFDIENIEKHVELEVLQRIQKISTL